ncbi:MAG: 3'-5' exonuclease [Treponema sp.]|jgi:DNA polymerase-3 subunit epsilon|nr:3'-5' exonuclease [Treponema sp.]
MADIDLFRAYREGKPVTAFDLETTGFDPKRDRIVEIGAVKFDRRGLICRYSVLVNPGIPMPAEAGRVNGITDAMLAGKPPIGAVLPDFLRLIKDTVIAAHNAPFDCGFINENLAALYRAEGDGGLFGKPDESWTPPFPVLPNAVADTLVLARARFPRAKSHALQELAQSLGIAAGKAHRAEDDAFLCMELFIRCGEER